MGNTEFFRQTTDLKRDFKWRDIFSEVKKPHTKVQKDKLLASGCETFMPTEGTMLKEWEKPWLFARFGVIGLLFCILMTFMVYFIAAAYSLLAMLIVVPAFVMPLTILIFFWEMNVPRNLSILDLFYYVMFAGAVSGILTFVIRNIFLMGDDTAAWIAGPIPEEIAKLLMVYLIIKKRDSKYISNGLLIGCAVGVGFAAQESAGYALSMYDQGAFSNVIYIGVLRGVLALGGHSVWASMYGAALVAAKKDKPLKATHIGDKLVLITFCTAVLLHVIWNFDLVNIMARFADMKITYSLYMILEVYYGKYILLIVAAWTVNFKLMRMGLVQVIDIGNRASANVQPAQARLDAVPAWANQQYSNGVPAQAHAGGISVTCLSGMFKGQSFPQNAEGKILFGRDVSSTVHFPEGTRGISGRHCEIKVKEGVPVLIDRGSTYGTYMADGKKLETNKPYRISNGMIFYLATKDNQFEIKM